MIELKDACVVVRSPDGEVHLHQAMPLVKTGALAGGSSGALWGTLIGLLFLNPLAGMALGAGFGAASGALAGKLSDYGIPDNFIKELGGTIKPNSSALFLLVQKVTADKVLPQDGGVQRPRAQDVTLGRPGKASARSARRYRTELGLSRGADRSRGKGVRQHGRPKMSSPEGSGGAPLYVSTGHLPAPEQVRALVDEAYERYKSVSEGENSSVYPALARVPSDLFGVCVVGTSGNVYAVGDAEHEFTIMSVSKPFVFALVCEAIGHEEARRRLGVNATGLPFNSLGAIEQSGDGRTNPMVNSGAIATTSLVPGATLEAKWQFIHEGLSRFAGRTLPLNDEVYASATATNFRNQSIARLLQSYERVYMDPAEATALYTKQCSLNVSARDLAVMGATLADGGVNPLTKERLVDPIICHYTLAVMATAGLYETSGDWLYDIGLPGKSGIGGGIVTVSPGKGGLGTFAPPLDQAGNSVKGQLVAKFLSQRLGLDLFVSQPEA